MNWLIVLYAILIAYVLFIISLTLGLYKLSKSKSKRSDPSSIKFSIVIPMRNEALNLNALFQSISDLSYPRNLFEIILVDDASQDQSWNLARRFQAKYRDIQIQLLSNLPASSTQAGSKINFTPKKNAIHKAISRSSHAFIITTDADVILPKHWLQSFEKKLKESSADLVAAGVVVARKRSFISKYQHFDMLSLQAFGFGSFALNQPVICNGANLCYRKEAYLKAEVNLGKENIASGDDVFTLEKFRQLGYRIEFLEDSRGVVWTKPVESFYDLWQQRRRWARKTISIESWYLKSIGILVTLMQLSLVVSLILGFREQSYLGFLINAFILKFIIDGWSLSRMAKFQSLGFCWTDFLWVSLAYPFFTLFFSITSLYGKFDWKGRKFSK